MSAHSQSQRGGWLSAVVAQVSEFVFEEVEAPVAPTTVELKPHPVIAVAAAGRRAGATTVARLLAAEVAARAGGAAVVLAPSAPMRGGPPSRAATRLATALTGVGRTRPVGRLCVLALPQDRGAAVNAARYLAPVVLDLPADGSAAGVAGSADRVVVVAGGASEPALLDAVAAVIGGDAIKVANRVADPTAWRRSHFVIPESRLGARAAAVGTRPLGALGSAIAALVDALEIAR